MYEARAKTAAVIIFNRTLPSPSRALPRSTPPTSCAIKTITLMRVGRLPPRPILPSRSDMKLAEARARLCGKAPRAMLLAITGPGSRRASLDAPTTPSRTLEETAKLFMLLHGRRRAA